MGPHRQMHVGLHGHTQTCTRTLAAHPLATRMGAALQLIWSPDPAGLSQSLVVGWGWDICPRGGSISLYVGLGHLSQGRVRQLPTQ